MTHRPSSRNYLCLGLGLGLAIGCGGGGGQGSGSSDSWLTFNPNPVSTTAVQGFSTPITFTATAHKTLSQDLYASIGAPAGMLDNAAQVQMTQMDSYNYQFNAWSSTSLPIGTNASSFTLYLFTDPYGYTQCEGSPWTIPFSVAIRPAHTVHKLLPAVVGVSLAKTPGWSRLSRTIAISDNMGSFAPWQASSNKTWLSVTPSGIADSGQGLTVTADPSGLPIDTLSLATVTLSSSDPSVQTVEKIIVGVWNGSTTPVTSSVTANYTEAVADPLRPCVYLHNGSGSIDVFNVYTHSRTATISTGAASLGAMAIAADGSKLYAADLGSPKIRVIDLTAGTVDSPLNRTAVLGAEDRLIYIRPNGVGVVLDSEGVAQAASDGRVLQTRFGASGEHDILPHPCSLAATSDGYSLYTLDYNSSPSYIDKYRVDYTDGQGGGLVSQIVSTADAGSNGKAVGVSGDGAHLYTVCGSPYSVESRDPASLASIRSFTGGVNYPTNVAVAWDGRVFGAFANGYQNKLVVYEPDGTIVTSFDTYDWLLKGQLCVSGDGTMAVGLTGAKVSFTPVAP